jgi:OPA family glycerol-3-phosphate transporter-like MFS transporter
MTEDVRLKKWQNRIFSACFIAYTAAYICRVNFSVAIPGLQTEFKFSNTNVGLISSAFFWVYALGQLVNGYLGDRFSSRKFIFTGLVISALINVAFGYSLTLYAMILLWGANGIFQSMLWGPIVKTLSYWFPNKKHNKVAFGMSITMIFGYLIAWSSSGAMLNYLGWQWVFWLASIIVIVLAFVWYFMIRNRPSDVGLPDISEAKEDASASSEDQPSLTVTKKPLWKIITGTNLVFVAITGIMEGIIKDSISLWSPKLLMDTQNLSLESTVAIVLIIPLVNFSGILLAGWLNRILKSNEKLTIMILMLGSAVTSLGLVFLIHASTVLSIMMLACTSAFMFGINPLMTTVIPLNYSYCDKVSSIAGFIDFSIYLGSGLAGILTGFIVDMLGWDNVFIMWFLVSILGALAMYASIIKGRKLSHCTETGKP